MKNSLRSTLRNALKTGFENMGFQMPNFIFGIPGTAYNQKRKNEKERIKQANFQKKAMNQKKNGIRGK